MAKKDLVENTNSTALAAALADYKGPLGTETIENEDTTLPRLKLGQAISEAVKTGAVKEGAIYMNVSPVPLWSPDEPPLPIIFVGRGKEYILWRPREDGGGILARARPVYDDTGKVRYKWDNPNTSFEVKVGGKVKTVWKTRLYCGHGKPHELMPDEDDLGMWGSELPSEPDSRPAATAHHNYLVLLPTKGNMIAALSLSKTGVKIANDLNANLKMMHQGYPLWARTFELSSVKAVSDGDEYRNWKIVPSGLLFDLANPDAASPEQQKTALLAMELFKTFLEGNYVVEQSGDDAPVVDGDVPF